MFKFAQARFILRYWCTYCDIIFVKVFYNTKSIICGFPEKVCFRKNLVCKMIAMRTNRFVVQGGGDFLFRCVGCRK